MSRSFAAGALALLLATFELAHARADHLIPGPGEPGYDATLAQLASGYDRQIHGILAVPLGFGLEAFVSNPTDRASVDAFIASGQRDFLAATGRHPYEVVDMYEENGDLGMFGGVQAAGDAFRYAVLRDSGVTGPELDAARSDLERAMDGLHWQTAVTGVPGVVARGIRRITPEAGEPPLPRPAPTTVPLHDAAGNPLPADKEPTWRDDFSGELPFLVWFDDCSKDQLDGYLFALGAIWDVVRNDDTVDASKRDRLVADARAIAQMLMTPREVAPGKTVDLVIFDADGRNTTFHDLSAREIAPGAVLPRPTNGFNALMALGMMRTLYEITGDEQIGRFYYDTLIEDRHYIDVAESNVGIIYLGSQTNYSNVNMAYVAAYGALRYESDPAIATRLREVIAAQLYERDGAPKGMGQSFFDLIYAGFRSGGVGGPGAVAVNEGLATLDAFPPAPWWDTRVDNCDATEIAAGHCLGIDGTTEIVLDSGTGHGGRPVSTSALPMAIRPPSNFIWRSDPRDVNGGGSTRLNPGGGFHAAYWMGRFLQASSGATPNISSEARARTTPRPVTDAGITDAGGLDAGDLDASAIDGGADAGTPSATGGCGCVIQGEHDDDSRPWLAAPLLGLLWLRRRRAQRSRRRPVLHSGMSSVRVSRKRAS
ncbi:MAG: hypothetical protein GW913_11210 [Myxococcales bacterium]|nr:hypothetical protein [Myxococcales bacterium]